MGTSGRKSQKIPAIVLCGIIKTKIKVMKPIKLYPLQVLFLALIASWNYSCQKEVTHSQSKPEEQTSALRIEPGNPGFTANDMVLSWNDKAATVLNRHTNPGSDSRSFAIIEIAVHDALNNIKPKYESYALNERDNFADPDAAVASAAYWSIKGLNLQGVYPVDQWYTESLATIPDGINKTKGIALGKKSADAIIANRNNDGLSQVIFVSPTPLNGVNPGEYRNTLPYSNPALNLPQDKFVVNWGNVMRPFVTQSNYQFRASGPYPVNSAQYTAEYNEVKSKGAMTGSTRTAEENQLSRFWSDLNQHIVWNSIAAKIIATKNMDAWKTARLFALLHTTMADGASAMFEAIYHYYYWRPETAIRIADDGNPGTESDPQWLPAGLLTANANPLLNNYNPRVPAYPSAFGIIGGAAGKVLQSIIGSDEINVDITSARLPGVVLHYSRISQAVSDNSISKIFTGWFFRKACIDGQVQGVQIANYVFNNSFRENDD